MAKNKALIVGINHYTHIDGLFGCVDDAHAVKATLERHADGTLNFDVKLLTGNGPTDVVTKSELRKAAQELFNGKSDTALFYFAGHGHIEATGGYLLASDSTADDGIALNDLLNFANRSQAKNKIIVLDSCYSGIAGNPPSSPDRAELSEGMTILTASSAEQYASEENGRGVFTELLVDALNGAAANLLGDVTPGSVYAHIDQALGEWQQRPIFKTNVQSFVSLRKTVPALALATLQRIAELFPDPGHEVQLDSSWEPEGPNPNPDNTACFAVLQAYNRVNLVVPVGAPHMYHAAMEGKSCKLTALGQHYQRLAARSRI